jgi:hypothetical protein
MAKGQKNARMTNGSNGKPRKQPKNPKSKKKQNRNRGLRKEIAFVATSGSLVNNTRDAITLRGVDYMSNVVVDATLIDGATLVMFEVNPSNFNDASHVQNVASSFERYRFTSLEFFIEPRFGTNIGGGYIAGFTPDPHEVFVENGIVAKSAVRQFPGSISASIWSPSVIRCRLDNTLRFIDTQPGANGLDTPWSSTGTLFVVLDGLISGLAPGAKASMSVEIRYTIQLSHPQLNKSIPSPTTFFVPETEVATAASFKQIAASTGTPIYTNFWQHSEYNAIYRVEPALNADLVTEVVAPAFARTGTNGATSNVVRYYSTYEQAEAVGTAYDVDTNALTFTASTGIEFPSTTYVKQGNTSAALSLEAKLKILSDKLDKLVIASSTF